MPLRGGGRRLMANTILNFYFDYRHTSLSQRRFGEGETSREYRWLLQQFFWKKWPYATKRAEVSSAHLSLKVVTRWSKSSPNVVFELSHVSPKFLKDVSKFCQSCVIVLPKLCRRCVQVVTKLYLSCIQVVSKLSPSCLQVVSKLLLKVKFFGALNISFSGDSRVH